MRANASDERWFLPAEEVERLAQANGIPDVPVPTLLEHPLTWLGLCGAGAVVLAGCGAWLLLRVWRRPPGEPAV